MVWGSNGLGNSFTNVTTERPQRVDIYQQDSFPRLSWFWVPFYITRTTVSFTGMAPSQCREQSRQLHYRRLPIPAVKTENSML